MPSLGTRYTLLIPTFNRSARLRSLLGYLAARRFGNPIRVLDSSAQEALAANRDSIERSGLDIEHRTYGGSIGPYAKFAQGVESVDTPYCSFCADDDIPFTDAWPRLLDFLDANVGFVAAHGLYVNVKPGDPFDIGRIVYDGPTVEAADGLQRLVKQVSAYQAIFYAIYRTDVLRLVLQAAQHMNTLLGQELLASSLTVVRGNTYRMPELYLARDTNPSIATEGWHPHQFLATDPQALFREYLDYRSVLLDHLMAEPKCRVAYSADQIQRTVDLVHLKYLAPMLSEPIMDYLVRQSTRADITAREIIEGFWRTFVAAEMGGAKPSRRLLAKMMALRNPARASEAFSYVRRLAALYCPLRFREKFVIPPSSLLDRMTIKRRTRVGASRHYVISRSAVSRDIAGKKRVAPADIRNMVGHFNDYV